MTRALVVAAATLGLSCGRGECDRATKDAALAEAKRAAEAFVAKYDLISVHSNIAQCGRGIEPLPLSPGADEYPTAAFHCVDGRCHVAFLTTVRGYNEVVTAVTMWPPRYHGGDLITCSRDYKVVSWEALSWCRRTAPHRRRR